MTAEETEILTKSSRATARRAGRGIWKLGLRTNHFGAGEDFNIQARLREELLAGLKTIKSEAAIIFRAQHSRKFNRGLKL
jgi:hypothetical protein